MEKNSLLLLLSHMYCLDTTVQLPGLSRGFIDTFGKNDRQTVVFVELPLHLKLSTDSASCNSV